MTAPDDETSVEARRVLLDALIALEDHRAAIVVVGAQAVYLRTSDLDLRASAFTTDADLALDLRQLGPSPTIGEAMEKASFHLDPALRSHTRGPGQWWTPVTIGDVQDETSVDLLVPMSDAPPGGSRGVRLPGHGKHATRKVTGLEPALRDNGQLAVASLDPRDDRTVLVRVAGSAALLVAKAFKIADRADATEGSSRLRDKDAADVYRLLVSTPQAQLVTTFSDLIQHQGTADVTLEGLAHLRTLFGRRSATGVRMARAALVGAVAEDQVTSVLNGVVDRVLSTLDL
jgi:hypothetical protein